MTTINQKYASNLEQISDLKITNENNLAELTSARLEVSEMKLKLQEKQQEMKEYRTKMEEKFMQ